MKKIVAIAIIGIAIYYFKPGFFFSSKDGAFDADGNPQAWVFTYNGCGKPCDAAVDTLNRRIEYTEFDISEKSGKQRLKDIGGGNQFPLTVIGHRMVVGSDSMQIISTLAEVIGTNALTSLEQSVMQGHFYEDDTPAVVMYGASWCGYCKQMRKYFNENDIQYFELDAEGSAKNKYTILRGSGFPLIYIGYRRINGANIDLVAKTIKELNI